MDTPTRRTRDLGTSALRASGRRLALVALVGALALAGCQAGDSLTGPTWQWVASDATGQAIPDAQDYTIAFRTDGGVTVTAGCITVDGTYVVGVPLDLTINLGAPAATCDAAPMDAVYLDLLADVESFATGGGTLTLDLVGDGAMQFRVAGA